jgi:hypothetical protein
MSCPQCKVRLQETEYLNMEIDHCPYCLDLPMPRGLVKSDKTLRESFSSIHRVLPDNGVTLSVIMELAGKESLLILSAFLTLPFLVPVSIPGVSTAFGAIILLIGISLILDRQPWFPNRFMTHVFPTDKIRACLSQGLIWVERLEKISHRRISILCHGHLMSKFNGMVVLISSILLMAPLAFIPFSNTFPALAILLLSIGILQHDGIFILLGYLFLIVTSFYFALIALMGVKAVNMAFKWF